MHDEYLHALTIKIDADEQILAAWLEGSFGRGNADRYSDLDVHLLLPTTDLRSFRANAESWLGSIAPLVLFRWLFDGALANALTADGLRIDLVLHGGEQIALTQGKAHVLVDKAQHIRWQQNRSRTDPPANKDLLLEQISEFWRCIALLPSVVGRDELVTGFVGLSVETNVLVDVLLAGYGVERDRGVKNLNQFLPTDVRQALEQALSLNRLTPASLAAAHVALARIMQQHGPIIAHKHRFAYPTDLEAAVLRYVGTELALVSLNALEPI